MTKTNYELAVELRSELGKGASRRARKAGKVPAVIYSRGAEPQPLFVSAHEWEALSKHDFNLVTLVQGKKKTAAVVKEVQNNYMKNIVVHIDFQEVKMDEKITTSVPVIAKGEAVGVSKGGSLEQAVHEIEVNALPADLPEHLEVDVTSLEIDQSIHVSEVVLPEKVELVTDGKLVVFTVAKPISEEAPAAEAAEEGAEEAADAE